MPWGTDSQEHDSQISVTGIGARYGRACLKYPWQIYLHLSLVINQIRIGGRRCPVEWYDHGETCCILSRQHRETWGSTENLKWQSVASPGVKGPGRKSDRSLSVSAEVHKAWSFAFSFTIRLYDDVIVTLRISLMGIYYKIFSRKNYNLILVAMLARRFAVLTYESKLVQN